MVQIPESFKQIFLKKTFVHLATRMPDGSPQVSPVWVDMDGDLIVINSAKGRIKDKNMRADPRIALSATDPDNPYRGLIIKGRVVRITEDGAEDHIDKMAKKYFGKERYPFRKSGETRVLYYVEPVKVATME